MLQTIPGRSDRKTLRTCNSREKSLLHIINDILDFTKLELRKIECQPSFQPGAKLTQVLPVIQL